MSELAVANRGCACFGCDVIGQDLREECIKLKMLVFDLERQNRALCELFQQKLPNQPAAHLQVASSERRGLYCPACPVTLLFSRFSRCRRDRSQSSTHSCTMTLLSW